MNTARLGLLWSRHLIAELRRGGMQHICICPGKRSLPLAVAALNDPFLGASSHIDERSAGFFALGLAKTTGRPVGIITTSGTAGAHLYPAVLESELARVPLVILTADRPPRLRDCGAPQALDQLNLYGNHTRLFADVGLPGEPRTIRSIASRAIGVAAGRPAGPVHLNIPFEEPLTGEELPPIEDLDQAAPWIDATGGRLSMSGPVLEHVSRLVHEHRRGLIVCGPMNPTPGLAAAVRSLAWRSGYAVLADPLSQLRCDPQCEQDILGGYDSFLSNMELAEELAPALVIRLGAPPTSKALNHALARWQATQVLVDGAGAYREPTRNRTLLASCDEVTFCRSLAETMIKPLTPDLRYRAVLDRAERRVWSVARELSENRWFEGALAAETVAAIPEGGILWVASSKPVRMLDSFCRPSQRALRIFASRGANGIDGTISQALGAASAAGPQTPVVLLCGDLAFLHDIGGLLAARRLALNLTVVVVNDDGGRIFDQLSITGFADKYHQFVATQHGMRFGGAAGLYGLNYREVLDTESLRAAITQSIEQGGTWVIEAPFASGDNLKALESFQRAVACGANKEKGPRSDANRDIERRHPVVQRGRI